MDFAVYFYPQFTFVFPMPRMDGPLCPPIRKSLAGQRAGIEPGPYKISGNTMPNWELFNVKFCWFITEGYIYSDRLFNIFGEYYAKSRCSFNLAPSSAGAITINTVPLPIPWTKVPRNCGTKAVIVPDRTHPARA